MSFKKCKVVMLSTNEKAQKGQLAILDNRLITIMSEFQIFAKPKHLYITSDEEIKEGDWFIFDRVFKSICRVDSIILNNIETCDKKIIATTDTSLKIKTFYEIEGNQEISLPQPSQQFIEKYIEEYNKSNVITDVLVEYIDNGEEGWSGSNEDGEPIWNEKIELKVNPKDNTITIKKVKDSWNREEHIQDIKRIILLEREYKDLTHHFIDTIDLDKFITDNL